MVRQRGARRCGEDQHGRLQFLGWVEGRDAVEYLLKPISLPGLLRAVERYRWLSEVTSPISDARTSGREAVNIRVDRRTVRLDTDDIVYIESIGDYVVIHTKMDTYTTKLRLGDLAEQLEPYGFLRIHRLFVADIRRVDAYTSTDIELAGRVIPVSRTYRKSVMTRLEDDLA